MLAYTRRLHTAEPTPLLISGPLWGRGGNEAVGICLIDFEGLVKFLVGRAAVLVTLLIVGHLARPKKKN